MDWPPIDPPLLNPNAFPVGEQPAVREILVWLDEISVRHADLVAAISLFIELQASRKAEDFSWNRNGWSRVACRDACIGLYNYSRTIQSIPRVTEAPTFMRGVDRHGFRQSKKRFKEVFPNVDEYRHAIAHSGERHSNPQFADKHSANIGGITISLSDCLSNSTYTTTYKGEVLELEMTANTLVSLYEISGALFRAFSLRT